MEPPESERPVNPGQAQDFVVIDRDALRQMLYAVLQTLRATANLEELRQGSEADPGQYALLQANMRMARERLIEGIQNMANGIEKLPSVKLRDR